MTVGPPWLDKGVEGASDQQKKRHRRPPASEIAPDTPIWCPACQDDHPASAFNKESRRYSGLHGICREAQARKRRTPEGKAKTRERNRRRWANSEYREASKEWQRARRRRIGASTDLKRARARLQDIVDDWKAQGCVDCGYEDIRAIEPDHVDPSHKHDNVSRMVTMCASAARIRAELEKCEPRCVRCHRKVTAEQRPNSWRTRSQLPPSWQRRLEHQDRVDALKLAWGCFDCGWAGWARGLEWDHVRGRKRGSVATLIANGASWRDIEIEIAKCVLTCSNCHRIRTLRRRKDPTYLVHADELEHEWPTGEPPPLWWPSPS